MAIREFTFDPSMAAEFIQFGFDVYRDDPKWIHPSKKGLYAQLSPDFSFYQKAGNMHRHFLARAGNRVVGRVSAFVNSDLKDHNGEPVGTVGFFECAEEYPLACDLLDAAVEWLRQQGIRRIWGPMNFDIWHGYRFMTKGFEEDLFYGEPYNKRCYPETFERYGFIPRHRWDSAETSDCDAMKKIIDRGKDQYRHLLADGYRFEKFSLTNFHSEVRKLHSVICSSFSKFLFFTPISESDFLHLFESSRYAIEPDFFRFVYDGNGRLVGFAGAFLELSQAVRSMNGEKNLISVMKFFYQRRRVKRIMFHIGGYIPDPTLKLTGLGRATFSLIMEEILEKGYHSVLNTLMVERNFVHALLYGQARQRGEYTLYELGS